MDVHKNARLTFHGRDTMVRRVLEAGQTPKAVATALGVYPKTVGKWVARYRAEGPEGLHDRSSRPRRLRRPTPEAVCQQIVAPPAPRRGPDRGRDRCLPGLPSAGSSSATA